MIDHLVPPIGLDQPISLKDDKEAITEMDRYSKEDHHENEVRPGHRARAKKDFFGFSAVSLDAVDAKKCLKPSGASQIRLLRRLLHTSCCQRGFATNREP